MSWPTASLGDLFEIARGGSPRPISEYLTEAADGVNWVSISDATDSDKFIRFTKRKITPAGVSRSRMVRPGDFLLTNSMSFGRPYIMATSGCIHDGWLSLSPKSGRTDPDFLFRALSSAEIYRKFERLAAGATVKNLNIELVKGVEIPLPPLDEQRRIAAILDQADTLRRKRREALTTLSDLERSIFVRFTDRTSANGDRWKTVALEAVSTTITDGEHQTPKRSQSGIKLLSARNVQMGRLDFSDVDFVDVEEFARIGKRCAPRRGDVLISCSGTIGRVAVVAVDEPLCLVRSVALVRPNLSVIHPLYLEGYLRTPAMQATMRRAANASGQPNLFQGPIRQLSIELPTMEVQQQVADVTTSLREVSASASRDLAHLDALFAALQHRAFHGEL